MQSNPSEIVLEKKHKINGCIQKRIEKKNKQNKQYLYFWENAHWEIVVMLQVLEMSSVFSKMDWTS